MSARRTDQNVPRPAEPSVVAANAAVSRALPFDDRQDFDDARRGFIATIPDAHLTTAAGRVAWTLGPYAFLDAERAADSVNPSLWRQARLNMYHGLFKVVDGLYQVRGFDLANMTLIETDSGLIVVDCTSTVEAARAGLELYFDHRGRRPVVAVVYTHTHRDHWGGALGVVSADIVRSGAVRVVAPAGFMKHATSEYLIAGNAMRRRAQFQFGALLPRGERQQVDAGLGKVASAGSVSLVAPTDLVEETGATRVVDGVELVFQMAPDTEAPAELHIYLPQFHVLNLAENATHTLHNLLPLRGAPVRNCLAWAQHLNEALDRWGAQTEVLIGQHHWPVWGNSRVVAYLGAQRDVYKYIHDQCVRLMNHGLKPAEIAETLTLPKSLETAWHTRGYYGHVRHNAKAIYQHYLGWYDGNPATLDPLPPAATGKKLVEYMGGADAVVARARNDFEKGEFRFVAQVMSHVVFAEPQNHAARALLADALEQLGYLAESSTWRNAYLFGAHELRHGMATVLAGPGVSSDVVAALDTRQLFDYMAVRVNPARADGQHILLNWRFSDTGEQFVLELRHCALSYSVDRQSVAADATVELTRATLNGIIDGSTGYADEIAAGRIAVSGEGRRLFELVEMLDQFRPMFEVLEPVQGT